MVSTAIWAGPLSFEYHNYPSTLHKVPYFLRAPFLYISQTLSPPSLSLSLFLGNPEPATMGSAKPFLLSACIFSLFAFLPSSSSLEPADERSLGTFLALRTREIFLTLIFKFWILGFYISTFRHQPWIDNAIFVLFGSVWERRKSGVDIEKFVFCIICFESCEEFWIQNLCRFDWESWLRQYYFAIIFDNLVKNLELFLFRNQFNYLLDENGFYTNNTVLFFYYSYT